LLCIPPTYIHILRVYNNAREKGGESKRIRKKERERERAREGGREEERERERERESILGSRKLAATRPIYLLAPQNLMLRLVGRALRHKLKLVVFPKWYGVLHIRLFRIRSAHLTGYFMLHVEDRFPHGRFPYQRDRIISPARSVPSFYDFIISPYPSSICEEEEPLSCASVFSP